MNSHAKRSSRPRTQLWIVPAIILLIIAITGGGYFAFSQLQELSAGNLRNKSTTGPAGQSSGKAAQTTTTASERLSPELLAKKQALDTNAFYEGIFVNDLPLAGLTREQAATQLAAEEKKIRDRFRVEITAGPQKLTLTPEQAGLAFDTQEVLATAFDTGRKSGAATESARIGERFAAVEALKQNPLKLKISYKADADKTRQAILDWATGASVAAKDAKAVSFDVARKAFKFEAEKSGTRIDAAAVAEEAAGKLAGGSLQYAGTAKTEPVAPKMTVAAMQGKLGLVSSARTLAGSESSKARDTNITKVVTRLNGMVIQPGATFSFNGTFGQRTAEKGFTEAGGIRDGILVQELGGGICQPNTTLYQAVLKADLDIVTRSPHSWPSAYTAVGLDATVSWPGPDFKFTNNTPYPVAIAASFNKPDIVVSLYGRPLEPGVSISLVAEHNGFTDEAPPIERLNPALPAGARVEVRKPRTGQKATSYKVWSRNGVVFKKELVAVSSYRPIQGIYELGPAKPAVSPTPRPSTTPGATPTPTAGPVTPTPGATTASPTPVPPAPTAAPTTTTAPTPTPTQANY